LITHDLNLVKRFAERICVMQKGIIVEQAGVHDLFRHPRHAYTKHLLDSEPKRLIKGAISQKDKPLLSGKQIFCHFPVKQGIIFKRIVSNIKAVDRVDVALYPGETLGIVGESGSGKTTLGMCLLRLQGCEGEIIFDSKRLDQLRSRELRPLRKEFQVVFQDPYSSLSPRMTVEEIVGEGLKIHFPKLNRLQRREKIVKVLREVGLDETMLWRYPHEFSGGQRQRIAIARVVILEPKLILLDEPTSALDVSVQKQVLELLRKLQVKHNISYLFITHDLKVVRAMAHRLIVMQTGKLIEQGSTEHIFTNPQHPYTQSLLQAALFKNR
jgi:microcin C transport system ATP-binding protein